MIVSCIEKFFLVKTHSTSPTVFNENEKKLLISVKLVVSLYLRTPVYPKLFVSTVNDFVIL